MDIKKIITDYIEKQFTGIDTATESKLNGEIEAFQKQIKKNNATLGWIIAPGGIALIVGIILVIYLQVKEMPMTIGVIVAIVGFVYIFIMCLTFGNHFKKANKLLKLQINDRTAKLIVNNAPALEKINMNELSNIIFKEISPKSFHVTFGLNKKLKQLFKLERSQNSYQNIFTFVYNGYRMAIVQEKTSKNTWSDLSYSVTSFNNKKHQIVDDSSTPPSFENSVKLIVYAGKPNDLTFKSETSLGSNKNVPGFYKKHPHQSPMDSAEFDKFLPCVRNNETQFRVLFTPAAQADLNEIFKVNSDYSMSMSTGSVLSIGDTSNYKDKQGFRIYHDISVADTKKNIIDSLINSYESGCKILEKLLQPFNALALYESPFLKGQNLDAGADDLNEEEIEVYLNSGVDVSYLFTYPIHGLIKVISVNANHYTILANSFLLYTVQRQSGKTSYTETRYKKSTTMTHCQILNVKTPIKYWKYKNWDYFAEITQNKTVCDIFELNDHMCAISHTGDIDESILKLSSAPTHSKKK